ncbi:hemoglobin [Leucobacter exalbidus]|uniref:Hemoglobin n=1 Tax=Leucobacter exalbidus TaxID=662960 RepID=A0A940PKU4_9MICO|nr:globin [Leucobacter exalbidus]MBP1324893.1 hemoglobin [Leucobacter exalbidus]
MPEIHITAASTTPQVFDREAPQEPTPVDPASLWAQVGGTDTFERLVRKFYDGVREDPIMAPMYPEDDWEGAIWRLRAFFEQYWGGPKTYSAKRGHPRLRMRHNVFPITPAARDRWLFHMNAALDEVALAPIHDAAFRDYIDRAAQSLVNKLE